MSVACEAFGRECVGKDVWRRAELATVIGPTLYSCWGGRGGALSRSFWALEDMYVEVDIDALSLLDLIRLSTMSEAFRTKDETSRSGSLSGSQTCVGVENARVGKLGGWGAKGPTDTWYLSPTMMHATPPAVRRDELVDGPPEAEREGEEECARRPDGVLASAFSSSDDDDDDEEEAEARAEGLASSSTSMFSDEASSASSEEKEASSSCLL